MNLQRVSSTSPLKGRRSARVLTRLSRRFRAWHERLYAHALDYKLLELRRRTELALPPCRMTKRKRPLGPARACEVHWYCQAHAGQILRGSGTSCPLHAHEWNLRTGKSSGVGHRLRRLSQPPRVGQRPARARAGLTFKNALRVPQVQAALGLAIQLEQGFAQVPRAAASGQHVVGMVCLHHAYRDEWVGLVLLMGIFGLKPTGEALTVTMRQIKVRWRQLVCQHASGLEGAEPQSAWRGRCYS